VNIGFFFDFSFFSFSLISVLCTTVFLPHHDSMVPPCYLRVSNTVVVTGGMLTKGQGSPSNHHSVPGISRQHGHDGSMLSPVKNTVILQCFKPLTLLVDCQEGHPACKSTTTRILKSFLLLNLE